MKKMMAMAGAVAAGLVCGGCGVDFQSISQEEAHTEMAKPGVLVLDVREPSEYQDGHIPGAVLFPVGTIAEKTAAEKIPAKDTEVLVYCRSGVRAKKGAQKLADLGYTDVREFGGIMTWPYEIEK